MDYGAIAIGSVLGACTRYKITQIARKHELTPWSTMAINATGSFILGALTSFTSQSSYFSNNFMLCAGTGFCGSYTTFSTFSVDTILLLNQNQISKALRLVAMTNISSIGFAYAGFSLFRKVPKL